MSNQNENDFTKKLEFWMTNLPTELRNLPIIDLAIPGSHNSITYGINKQSKLAPDAEPSIRKMRFLGPILINIMVKWSKTQITSLTDQLQSGIRYFDLRIAKNSKNGKFYFVHGLYSDPEVNMVFEEMRIFLETHPKEILILDCQHFYAFQQSDHENLMYLLTTVFSHKMLPYIPHMEHITLHYMTVESKYQVIVIYRSDAARFGQPLLWPAASFPTPWANTVSITNLIAFLTDRLKKRNKNVGFVSQCILTPTAWFLIKHLCSTLKNQCFLPLQKEKYKWLRNQKPGRGGLNIVISDFVDYEDAMFAEIVVGLNWKLVQISSGCHVKTALTPVN